MKICDECGEKIKDVYSINASAKSRKTKNSKSFTVKGDYCKECAIKKAEELSGEVFR